MQGEFPLMLFALPAACLAMYHEAHTKNKKCGRYSVLCGADLLPDGDHRTG
jgi:phosphotransferase system  glucose/maltose/N-acetylglucosamine-specific IIC component